ncbi:hypothetical protein RSSM_02385 [Rhodopirellula sallentina SM41]|uniref:Uncharacterized protein n=1 Tax=Rhodopirellula sallentina SM41 TaxID=1263870 RepID=M5UJJ6_9BACT|nr:hypothetical protein RSSM_02385 [Rhodopirellula sallentina SM41]
MIGWDLILSDLIMWGAIRKNGTGDSADPVQCVHREFVCEAVAR